MAPGESYRGRGGGRGARGGRGGSGAGRGRGGFKVGPSHAPSNAYLAKKIKQDLIDRARIKKSFAKTLKKEGLTSERLGSSGNATVLGTRANGYGQQRDKVTESDRQDGRVRNAVDGDMSGDNDDLSLAESSAADLIHSHDDDDDESLDSDEDDFEEDENLAELRRKMKGKGRDEGHDELSDARGDQPQGSRQQQRRNENPVGRFNSGSGPSAQSTHGSMNARPHGQSRRENPQKNSRQQPQQQQNMESSARVLTQEEASSIRELKRQAYLGFRPGTSVVAHPSRTRKQHQQQERRDNPTPCSATANAGKTVNTKNVHASRTAAVATSKTHASSTSTNAGKRRDGRPNLNARMGLLLEQIQRSK